MEYYINPSLFSSTNKLQLLVNIFEKKQRTRVIQTIIVNMAYIYMGFPGGTSGKEPSCHCRRCKRRGSIPGQRRRAWQSTPVFWPGESLGQRSLAGHSP